MGLPSVPYRGVLARQRHTSQGGGCRINPLGPSIYSIVVGFIALVGRESMLLLCGPCREADNQYLLLTVSVDGKYGGKEGCRDWRVMVTI